MRILFKISKFTESHIRFVMIAAIIFLAGCSNSSTSSTTTAPIKILPIKIIPTPAGSISESPLLFNGGIWVLAGNQYTKTLTEYDSKSGTIQNTIPTSKYATFVSTSDGITLEVGTAGPNFTGSIMFYSGITGQYLASIATPASVVAISALTGKMAVALQTTRTAKFISIVDTVKRKIVHNYPAPIDAISVSKASDPSSFFVLTSTGSIELLQISTGQIGSEFNIGNAGRSIILASNSQIAYILKCETTFCNVTVLNTSTEEDLMALPAPANAVAISDSPDGSILYELSGTLTQGNLQIFDLSGLGIPYTG
jgi:hypothetical protein